MLRDRMLLSDFYAIDSAMARRPNGVSTRLSRKAAMPHRNSSKPKHRRTTTAFAPHSHGLRRWAPLLLLVAVGCVAYSESFSGIFLFDDLPSILENEHLRQLKHCRSGGLGRAAHLAGPSSGRGTIVGAQLCLGRLRGARVPCGQSGRASAERLPDLCHCAANLARSAVIRPADLSRPLVGDGRFAGLGRNIR